MTTATLDKKYLSIGALLNGFSLPTQKSVSAFKTVIHVTTDKKSVTNSKKLIGFLLKIQDDLLPKKNAEFNDILIKKNLENINNSLSDINKFFEGVDTFFDHSEDEVLIDDHNMNELIANMKKA